MGLFNKPEGDTGSKDLFDTAGKREDSQESKLFDRKTSEATRLSTANIKARSPRREGGFSTGAEIGRPSNISFDGRPKNESVDVRSISSRLSKEHVDGLGMKTFDFLFGPESAIIGIAHDSEGWSWNVDNARQQWSEEPLWVNVLAATSLVGTIAFPATRALWSFNKFGKGATALRKAAGTGAEEIAEWQKYGMLADQSVKSYSQLDDATIQILRKQKHATGKYEAMKDRAIRAESGLGEPLKNWEKVRHEFESRFSQTYNALVDDAANGGLKGQFHEMHNKLWQNDTVGTILREMPDAKSGDAIYGYILGQVGGPALAAKAGATFGRLSAKNQKWADFYLNAARTRQTQMLESGFITQEQYMRIGKAHIPALNKGTPELGIGPTQTHLIPIKPRPGKETATHLIEEKGIIKAAGKTESVPIQMSVRPRLAGPTTMHRTGTHEDIFERLIAGDLITDPADMTVQGYMSDGLLHTNFQFITDMILKDKGMWTAPAELVAKHGGSSRKMAKLGFTSLEYAGDGAAITLRRMIAKQSGQAETNLPWIREEVFKGIFGVDGMMHQVDQISGNLMDVMTTVYKTMKTAGSIPTHIQNLTGNMSFLAQAGFNLTSPENIALMGTMTGTFNKIAKINSEAKKAGLSGRAMFDQESVLKGIDLGVIKKGSIKGLRHDLDLKDEFFDPAVRELLEESAFESVEGSAHLERMERMLKKEQRFTKGAIKGYMGIKKFAQVGDRVKWFDGLTKAYLAEDMVPKMTYFISLRAKGLSRKAAVAEVARRLPMYGTVGSAIKLGRKFAFPWATFPAEAMRITKNNIMDHPLRMIPWLRTPQIVQSVFSGVGFSGDAEEVAASKKQLPFWAQKHTTILGTNKAIAGVGGGASGGLFGAVAGAVVGKTSKAAYATALAGAGLGAFAGAMGTDDDHANEMRGAMLDFLPYSTFMLANNARDFGGEYLPFKDLQGMLEQMPAEPLAILKPMISAFSGETPFGEPVGDGTLGGGISKTIAGMLGFMAPPLLQKYGFKLTTPDVPMWGDPTGISNVSRLLIDTGNAIDPMTGRPGSMTNDFWLNNFGAFKSYKATGEQQIANEALADRQMNKIRSHLTKNLKYFLDQEDDKEVIDILTKVQGSFSEQFLHDPRLAQGKYTDWLKRQGQTLGLHPKLKGWSHEELMERLDEAGGRSGMIRSRAREELIGSLRDQIRIKGGGR